MVEDLYGFDDPELEHVRPLVEAAIGQVLRAHDSLYLGGDYFRSDDRRFRLQTNRELEEPMEPEWPSVPTLLYAVSVAADDLRQRLEAHSGARHLRRTVNDIGVL